MACLFEHIHVQTNAHFFSKVQNIPSGRVGELEFKYTSPLAYTYRFKNWLIKKAAKVAQPPALLARNLIDTLGYSTHRHTIAVFKLERSWFEIDLESIRPNRFSERSHTAN